MIDFIFAFGLSQRANHDWIYAACRRLCFFRDFAKEDVAISCREAVR